MNHAALMPVTSWASFARTARDLMTSNPVSIGENTPVDRAAAFLVESGVSAAPVINAAGRPVGVLSRTDLVCHLGGKNPQPPSDGPRPTLPEFLGLRRVGLDGDGCFHNFGQLFPREERAQAAASAATTVREIMTPAVVSVRPEDPVEKVVRMLVGMEIHRLFVVNAAGVLVGVITTLDVLRSLCRGPND